MDEWTFTVQNQRELKDQRKQKKTEKRENVEMRTEDVKGQKRGSGIRVSRLAESRVFLLPWKQRVNTEAALEEKHR